MKANYPYPKNEFEFYSREYSIEQLIENYDVSNLMEYYLFGMNCIKKMNTILEGGLFELVDRIQSVVEQDKAYFLVRTHVIKTAMEKMTTSSILICNDSVMLTHNN